MHYCDTSFLTPLIRRESLSGNVTAFVAELPERALAVSHLTRIEFSSLIARDIRMGVIDVSGARDAVAAFEAVLRGSLDILLPAVEDYDLAKDYLTNYETGLRAADALHLAAARNRGAEAIYTLDKTMLKAGKALGLPVDTGIKVAGYAR